MVSKCYKLFALCLYNISQFLLAWTLLPLLEKTGLLAVDILLFYEPREQGDSLFTDELQ